MGKIPVSLVQKPKSDKDLTLICQQQKADTPNIPWTYGKWVSIYLNKCGEL